MPEIPMGATERPMIASQEDREIRGGDRSNAPSHGGYYWFPTPVPEGVRWSLLTCDDLGLAPDEGHPDLWPAVIDRLAIAWGRRADALRRDLGGHYTGLPRGRVTRPGRYLILHGDDAPVADGLTVVIRRFRLERARHRAVFDEHERTLPEDRRRVEVALGISIPASPGRRSHSTP
jgi:hypothetical protein